MNAIQPMPIEIDPRPCELCGLTIDRHQMIDEGEGPEFLCLDVPVDELTLDELERRAELRRQEEIAAMVRDWAMADPRDRWRHTGGPMPAIQSDSLSRQEPYATPQSVVDAFWFVASLDDPDRLKHWLDDHPRDVAALQKLWEDKHARSR
jgi:hypothetical protein